MIAQDVVDKLSEKIPLYTDGFSASVPVTGITVAGTTATCTTGAAHNLVEGQNVAILGAQAPVQIDVGTYLRTGSTATFETLQDHDLTLSARDASRADTFVNVTGANEAELNGAFLLIRVVTRRKVIIAIADSGATTMTGTGLLANANGNVFNGLHAATNVTPTTFDYTLPYAYPLDAVTTGATVQISIRVTSVLDIEQYLRDVYTRKTIGEDVLVVQLGDVSQSKRRNEETDAASSATGENAYNPVLLQPFAVYIVMNVTDQVTAAEARDKVEREYVPAVFRALLRESFASGFTSSSYRATFTGHGVFAYSDTNHGKAVYAHEVAFEQLTQLCRADMVGAVDNVAMRDVSYTLTTDLGTGELTANVDLDEEPIE